MAKSVWEGHLRLSLVTCPGFEYVKTFIADMLHNVAEGLGQKAADQEGNPAKLSMENGHPSGWTNQPSTFGNSTINRQMPGSENTSGRARGAAS